MAHFHSYVSQYRDIKDTEDDTNQAPDTTKPDLNIKDTKAQLDCFPCPHCERRFTCKQGLERHMHIHNKKPTLEGAVQPDSSSQAGIETSEGHHPCHHCSKVFNSLINRQRHERRFHEVQSEAMQDENAPIIIDTDSQELETGQAGQYILDISSNISENLSFFIDGKLVSASTLHETTEASALVSVDALILNSTQVVNDNNPDLATTRFKRRTSTPQRNEDTPDIIECNLSVEPIDNHNYACDEQAANEKSEPAETVKESESTRPLVIGGNSCNQKPLDLSNAVKRSKDVALANAVLDLRVQKKSSEDSEQATDMITVANVNEPNRIDSIDEQNTNLAPLVTDYAIVTGSDLVSPVEQITDGLVYGLAIPTNSLTPSPTSLAPVTLQPTIAFASPSPHAVLPATPSLITVLATPSLPTQPNQPLQVLAPNLTQEPLVICTDNTLNADLSNAITAANSANLVTLAQPIDPTLNIPGHVFLADPISLNPPLVESTPVALNDLNSFNIASNTVLIECTLSLEATGNVVPTAIPLQENQVEQPTQVLVNHIEQQQIVSVPTTENVDSAIVMSSVEESVICSTATMTESPTATETGNAEPPVVVEPAVTKDDQELDEAILETEKTTEIQEKVEKEENLDDSQQQTFTKNFICNVCDKLFHSMKELGQHVADHAGKWQYKCEFCLLLFEKPSDLLEHRSSLHGVGKTYVCSVCTKEFVYLCNLKHHQEELHPGQQCTHTEEEKGKLRPQNYNNISKDNKLNAQEETKVVKKEESNVVTDELFTTIKILASDNSKLKGPDVRMGINQHYPSFKPPPFPYHNRSPAASHASATNFTTHNIPQTFSTAIRCTKCGKSFNNMPELHQHILACANASDKRRYTPKKNPIPLRHFAKGQNGVLSTTNLANGLNTEKLSPEAKLKLKVLTKRQKKLAQKQKALSLSSSSATEMFVCPHCKREFTMRRSRTKHMAVCPKKPAEKRKDGIANENERHQLKAHAIDKSKLRTSMHHKTRLQTGSVKRPVVESIFSSKRSKLIIKESQEATLDNELPVVRTFNPAMRQYTRVHHSIKELPIKITIVKPQKAEQQGEQTHIQGQEATPSAEQTAVV
ncbi:PR domain zinc finger protein 2 [Periophthalmus magnuspinnatus]|uniref:PR domain zinc finger protein 2 n=1 Tax=Periophthalmus magnuspinnatus TaxID=409849 RepID=UPI00145BB83D|nr:PR domain zinc finger protein 2 [Periophthalmus magnuspinnatus]